jgi:hypothetical protein
MAASSPRGGSRSGTRSTRRMKVAGLPEQQSSTSTNICPRAYAAAAPSVAARSLHQRKVHAGILAKARQDTCGDGRLRPSCRAKRGGIVAIKPASQSNPHCYNSLFHLRGAQARTSTPTMTYCLVGIVIPRVTAGFSTALRLPGGRRSSDRNDRVSWARVFASSLIFSQH